jgi:hypothetical protein
MSFIFVQFSTLQSVLKLFFSFILIVKFGYCHDPKLGLTTKAKAWKRVG